jgi:replicative DNA helicase
MFQNTKPTSEALGCAILDTIAVDKVLTLDANDFDNERDRAILSAMRSIRAERKTVSLVSLDAATGGQYTDYLIEISTGVATTKLVDEHIRNIKDSSKRRAIRAAATELFNAADDMSKSLDELTAEFAHRVDSLAQVETGVVSANDALHVLVNELDSNDTGKAMTGIPMLDQALGGMHGGRLYVIGARPATGKTALAISAAYNTCPSGEVLFCSYEMQPSEIMGRIMARLSRVNSQDISYKTLTNEQMGRLVDYYNEASRLPIWFGVNTYTPDKVRAEALRMKTLKLIVIDYLQLMSSGRKAESRRVEVGHISRALKQLSIELNEPVLALSQMNRVSEGSPNRAPTMSEMRESGDIEQDAEAIILMYQLAEKSSDFADACAEQDIKPVRILLDKNRQGQSGVAIDTAFDGSTMTFISKSAVMGAGK